MSTSQTEEVTETKPDSEESGKAQEGDGKKTEAQEPAAAEAPAETVAAEKGSEETQEQKAADDKADSEGSGAVDRAQIVELSTESFKVFCADISAMFSVPMHCKEQGASTETVESLKERFKNLVAVTSIKADGALDETFQIIFGRAGLFTLAGAISMPAEMTSLLEKCVGPEKVMKNIKSGSLKEAEEVSDTVVEACNLLVGSWDRVFREGLEGHKHLVQMDTFIGEPWDNPKEKIGLGSDEELVFASYKITIGSYPPFDCGVIFPKIAFNEGDARVQAEAEAKAKAEAEEKAKAEAEEKAKAEAEEKAKAEAEEKAKAEAEEKAKAEAEEKAKAETEAKAKAEAEEKAKAEAEAKAKAEAEEKAKAEAEAKAKAEAEEKAKAEAEAKAKAEAEEKAKAEAEAKAKAEAEEKAKAEAEAKAKAEAEEKAKAEAEEKAKAEAEEKAKAEAETKAKAEAEAKAENESEAKEESKDEAKAEGESEAKAEAESEEKTEVEEQASASDESHEAATGKISESIQKITQSPAILPGESGSPTMAHISISSGVCAKDIMQKEVVWAGPDESVQDALTKMQQGDSGYIMIGNDVTLEGIVSRSDITGATSIYLRPIFAKWHSPLDDATLQIKLKWIMSRPVRTASPDMPLATIIENMSRFGGRGLPVIDKDGQVQGLVTVFDIFRTLVNTNEDACTVGKTAEAPALT